MEERFHPVNGAEAIPESSLTLPRARALHDAVRHHKDYALVETLHKKTQTGELSSEVLVVEVSCDGIPPSNLVGIDFTERLAFCVPKNPQALIEVLALRRGFPLLMHQNFVLPDEPPNLCLYQEPPRSVARTWTAPSFLKRIQFWLEHSARGTLHSADQPVEQLFFESPFKLVLPWNIDSLLADPNTHFSILKGPDRKEGGATLFLDSSSDKKPEKHISIVNISLPTVVHGRIESDCGNIGQLADVLSRKGVDLVSSLTAEAEARVGAGIEESKDGQHTVILLHIPVSRAEGEAPSRVVQKAYLLLVGMLKLGEAMGILCSLKQDKVIRYYRDLKIGVIEQPTDAGWRNHPVLPMEVLRCIDRPAARFQSGVTTEGPSGALIGAGALGSALLDMWMRSGWGEWSVIDNDYIKPHNLVRHQAEAWSIGMSKAEVASIQINQVMQGAAKAKAVHADVCELTDLEVLEVLRSSTLVVDASTTLDYPRLASVQDNVGRHASVFVTPSGGASALLLEDAERKTRLRTLEAQYYRAILSEEWGKAHLEDNLGSFRSGASCRDISFVMPYSSIVGHAATIADQILRLSSADQAAIRIWSQDPISGAVTVHYVEARTELLLPFSSLDLSIDAGVYDKMLILRNKHLPVETGGILLGYYDFNVNSVVVVDALPAPRDSKASNGSFERGLDGVMEAVIEAGRRTAGIVGYIGEWHSHPKGYSAAPSCDDKYQLVYLTQGLAMEGLPAVVLIVSDDDLCALQGSVR